MRAALGTVVAFVFLLAPTATAHISDAIGTDLARGPEEAHTLAFSMAVHANASIGVLGSLKVARESGVDFGNATVTFYVVQGPANEFMGNATRFNEHGDLVGEFRDFDMKEDVVRVEVRFTGVDSSRAWRNGEISHALAAFAYPSFETEGNATAPFHLDGDPDLKPRSDKGLPGPGLPLLVAAVALALIRSRARRGPSSGR